MGAGLQNTMLKDQDKEFKASTLAFKVLIWIFAITRNICNHNDSTQAHAPGLHTHHSGVEMYYKHD